MEINKCLTKGAKTEQEVADAIDCLKKMDEEDKKLKAQADALKDGEVGGDITPK